MKIIGANLGEKEVAYKKLSEWPFFKDESLQDIVKKLEKQYLDFVSKSNNSEIKPMQQEDGKVIIKRGMINHRCSNIIESLSYIKKYGILASEWFGEIESEHEGVFCAFVDRVHDENENRGKILNCQRLNSRNSVLLFFDESNPLMQELLHLDYFEYEKIKQIEPDKLQEIYSEEEIQMFNQIIEPFSKCGEKFHVNTLLPYLDWSAIPGGIPANLINGICTAKSNIDKNYILELSKLFPNATIFNGNLEILQNPINKDFLSVVQKENDTINPSQIRRQTLKSGIGLNDINQIARGMRSSLSPNKVNVKGLEYNNSNRNNVDMQESLDMSK